nr:MAG TPA_asm: hypothetical protein [Caudoviricetes sp.]
MICLSLYDCILSVLTRIVNTHILGLNELFSKYLSLSRY